MSLLDTYRQLGSATTLDDRRAGAIVAEAMPHAVAALGRPRGESLLVSARVVTAEVARGGSLIPAWPVRQADGSVVIEYVADWGAMLAAFLMAVGASDKQLAENLVVSGQRVWIGIANDVLQLFVVDPPAGTYSMVRHHALMLAAATVWLGPEAIRDWANVCASAGGAFVRRHADQTLWDAIDAAERGLDTLLAEAQAHQTAPRALAWLDATVEAGARYVDYLGAASLGVAAVLDALQSSGMELGAWLAGAVADLHADPAFNHTWIEETARRLLGARTGVA